MNNLRIYMTISTFHPLVGGIETQTLAQARNLREKGYEATIITFRHSSAWLAKDVIAGVPVIRVAGLLLGRRERLPKTLQRLLYLLALLVMGWRLWQHRQHYDMLHVCQLTLLALPAAIVCRLTGKPILVVPGSMGKAANSHSKLSLMAGPLDATAPYLQVDENIRVDGDIEGLERFGKLVVRLVRSMLRRTRTVIVILSSRMKMYLTAYDFNLLDVQLIPNGVDINRFHPSYASTADYEREQTVICVSRLSYEKGIDVLLQAWYLVHKQASQARLIIVGYGPLQAQFECMAKALDIADSIEFAGLRTDVPVQLCRGGLAVLPSRWEGMPNALLEAMACGLPCVATRVSGSEDIILHGINGLLVEPEDYQGMAQALLTLLRDPALAQCYGSAARTTIEQHYSLEHVTDMYIELYQKMIGCRLDMTEEAAQSSKIYHLSS